jgi:hypothetical protein
MSLYESGGTKAEVVGTLLGCSLLHSCFDFYHELRERKMNNRYITWLSKEDEYKRIFIIIDENYITNENKELKNMIVIDEITLPKHINSLQITSIVVNSLLDISRIENKFSGIIINTMRVDPFFIFDENDRGKMVFDGEKYAYILN